MLRKLLSRWAGTGKGKKKPAPSKKKDVPRKKTASKKRAVARKKPVAPPKRKSAVRKKPSGRAKSKPASKKAGDEIGEVVAFFRIPVVAVVRLKRGALTVGERIWIKGHTTDFQQDIASMQVNHQPVSRIRKGEEAGIKVASRTRIGDRVYRISP